MSKFEDDFNIGKNRRESTIADLNSFDSRLQFVRMHPHLKYHSIRSSNLNSLKNRHMRCGIEKAMGLFYYATFESRDLRIPFKFLYRIDGANGKQLNLYEKLPKEYVEHPKDYLKLMAILGFYLIIVDEDKYSFPISYESIRKHWSWYMSTSVSNRNRLNYRGPASSIRCYPPTMPNLDGNLIQQIIKLFEQ